MMTKSISWMVLAILVVANVPVSAMQTKPLPLPQEKFRSPQSIDGGKKGISTSSATPTTLAADTELAGSDPASETAAGPDDQRIFDALYRELDNMIPGEFEDAPQQKLAVENAVKAFQKQDIEELKKILTEQANQSPDFPPADLLLASLSYAVKDTKTGLALLESAAIEHPEHPGVFSAFARLALNQGRISDALAMFEKCSKKIDNPALGNTAKEYYVRLVLDGMIDVAMKQERYSSARGLLEKQRKRIPENAKVMMVSAELEFREGNIAESQKYLETLKDKFPSTRVPETILAAWSARLGNAEDSEKWIRAAAEKHPTDAQVQLEFASWAVNNEDFPAASSAIVKAEKSDAETPFSRNLKAKIAFANQAYGVAESHYEAIAQQQPGNFDAINMFALSLIENKDADKQKQALEIATRNLRALPENLVAQAALGYISLKLGNKDQATQILARAARTPGTAPEIDYFLASLLETAGEPQQAKLVIQGALKHDGLFLYRSPANQLLKRLNKGFESLPTP